MKKATKFLHFSQLNISFAAPEVPSVGYFFLLFYCVNSSPDFSYFRTVKYSIGRNCSPALPPPVLPHVPVGVHPCRVREDGRPHRRGGGEEAEGQGRRRQGEDAKDQEQPHVRGNGEGLGKKEQNDLFFAGKIMTFCCYLRRRP